jgi:glyoxylase-like metal-dependent hydrolase (beta-lactamase superfamily II)
VWQLRKSWVLGAAILAQCNPVLAQIDLSGEWQGRMHEDLQYRGAGPDYGEYEGFPINEAARLKAESWNASVYTLPERQCIPFAADHGLTFGSMRLSKEVDPASQKIIAWKEVHEWQTQQRTIWMDGRPHPPRYAPHTWQGFSTGQWEGNVLKVTTTHLKMALVDRNGLPRSDLGTLTEHYVRHDNVLSIVQVVNDPVYLTEPFIRGRNYELNPALRMEGYSCRPAVEIAGRPKGEVPHYLPGTNPFLNMATQLRGVPPLATRGGAQTSSPLFINTLRTDPNANVLRVVQPYQRSGRSPRRGGLDQPISNPYLAPKSGYDSDAVEVFRVRENLYLLQQDGEINVTLQIGESGAVVVDTGYARASAALLAKIRSITSKPIRYVVNTAFTADRTGGNTRIAEAGSSIGGSIGAGTVIVGDVGSRAMIIAHEEVLNLMSATRGSAAAVPSSAWPAETYNAEWDEIPNSEAIQIYSAPKAYSKGDSFVFFRGSDVISAGNLYSTLSYPVIDIANGGSISGIIDGLNRIIDLAVPLDKQEGGTLIIPGRGRITDEADIVEYRDMLTIIRDRLREMHRKGMTLDEALAARPTADYDPRYSTSDWPAEKFIEAAYRSLASERSQSSARR